MGKVRACSPPCVIVGVGQDIRVDDAGTVEVGELVAARVAIHGAGLVVAARELGGEIFDRIRGVLELRDMHPLVSNDMAGRHEPADICGRRAFAYVVQLLRHVSYSVKVGN